MAKPRLNKNEKRLMQQIQDQHKIYEYNTKLWSNKVESIKSERDIAKNHDRTKQIAILEELTRTIHAIAEAVRSLS